MKTNILREQSIQWNMLMIQTFVNIGYNYHQLPTIGNTIAHSECSVSMPIEIMDSPLVR